MYILKAKLTKEERETFESEFDDLLNLLHTKFHDTTPNIEQLKEHYFNNPIADTMPILCKLHNLMGDLRYNTVNKIILEIE